MAFCRFLDAEERTPADPLAGQLGKPPFHQIEPTGTGGHEVKNETRMAAKPRLDLRSLMGAVVIHDQMQRHFSGKLLVQTPQPLLMPMPRKALADHPTLQNVQGGEQGRRSVALVIVRQGPATPLLQGQTGLGAIQGCTNARVDFKGHSRSRADLIDPRISVESRMAAVPTESRSVSHPRSSNRTCGFPASGSPTDFTMEPTGILRSTVKLGGELPVYHGVLRRKLQSPDLGFFPSTLK